ncbi:GGDEF domain-containing protein [Deinococcus hopiensis]|uniref:Diguanylate cyclase (GGDEF) domain-containing protein n=1 Tax=Deinococcus hopiensis KR-140 TaxID=695939 RepID=A0A1W1VUQ8_9DEIO|nr:GGDEF domain-containing protein [Deinococcus hopiensis]SMB97003.1 diguanylate cyclase (GGDEF) domain-containing protein [Deinococcus hopiensis KR-140]
MGRQNRRKFSGLDAEAWRYRFYVSMTGMILLGEAGVALYDHLQRGPTTSHGWESTFGALFCGAILAALLSRRITLRFLDLLVTFSVSLVLVIQLIQQFQSPALPEPRLYFIGLFVILATVTNLPLRPALLWMGVIMLAYLTLILTRPAPQDFTLLVEMSVVVLLILQLGIFGRQITSERTEGLQYRTLALTDSLTGLFNRRAMYDRLQQVLEERKDGRPFAVVLLDLDHFKAINDRYGHDAGDQVLQRMAAVLKAGIREGDWVARWGGEEFLVLLRGVNAVQAEQITARFRQSVRETRLDGLPMFTASFGVTAGQPGDDVRSLLQRADALLYRAKSLGRDQWQTDASPLS